MSLRLTWLDVFTSERLSGNGLAVVHGADGLSDDTMLRFARETNLSETSFVWAGDEECDYVHRIFTPGGEIPFAGHPSLGTAVAIARARGERAATYLQRTRPGVQPVTVELDGDGAEASMLQEPAVFGEELDPADVLPAVGLDAADADPALPCQFVSTGVPNLMVPVTAGAVARARPGHDSLEALLGGAGAVVLYLAAVDPATGQTHARSFAGFGVEDPATGSAAGPLCALVAAHTDCRRLDIRQGIEMGRASRLLAEIEDDRVRVSGQTVVVLDGQVRLDT